MTNQVKIGIIGTGRIANRFVPEARDFAGIGICAVYNPRFSSADGFAAKHGIPAALNDWDALMSAVDAVYIASPHATHYRYVHDSLNAGKHVLCEKPMVLSGKQARELYSLAENKCLVLMEAIKTAYCPGFIQVMNLARSGAIGEIRDVEATFTKLAEPELREMTDTETGGSFLELASYTLLPIIKLLGPHFREVRFDSFYGEHGVDLYTKVFFKYDSGWATSKTGLGVKSEGQLIISGTKGYIRVGAPWWKTRAFEICFEDVSLNQKFTVEYIGEGLHYEISEFMTAISRYKEYASLLSPQESIALADIIEARMIDKEHDTGGLKT
ncbi:hypothetical protein PAT3040_00896 [Paenibacillus agaridevorans]|uniref:Uncharacterized protein n=1 Tax=Paenibacillus agaridevorans TaxID=171404 RepID=A0A2R5ESJ5_9BACL|nr:Gfo/Idh/MocA family oxidoreductase [Paenibacillus agaridevorans]GBG06371.1 hypothetical protein PAT3040_00896 [Paenibacillus agaridevorans]